MSEPGKRACLQALITAYPVGTQVRLRDETLATVRSYMMTVDEQEQWVVVQQQGIRVDGSPGMLEHVICPERLRKESA